MDGQNKEIKKIAFVINKVTLSGGAERVVCTLASELSRRGIDTTIITQQNTECGYSIDENVKIWAAKANGRISIFRNFVRNSAMRKYIKKQKFDVVISFITAMNIQTILFTRGLKSKIVISERIFPATIKQPKKFFSKIIYPLADGIVFQTEEARNCFKGKVRKKGCVIFNPLTQNLPSASETKSKYIVTVGRLTEQKNHKLLISAFKEFSENHPDYELRIYGSGPLKQELKQFSESLDISDKVRLMGAVENVTEYIKDAAMFVLSSDFEGMPNVLAEAMAIGLPCVSTDCLGGGAAALIKDGENGLLVPCNNVQSLLAAIEKVADDTAFAEAHTGRAKEIKDELSVERIAQNWLDYCKSLF